LKETGPLIEPEKGAAREAVTHEMNAPLDDEATTRTPPPHPTALLNYLHSFVAIPLIYLYTLIMGSLSLLVSFFDTAGRRQHWCARVWARMICVTVGARVRVHGAEHVRQGESYVFLSTHQSYMDIPVMLGYLPAQLRIAAKKEVFTIPFLGWHMRRAGHISIDRRSSVNAIASLQRAATGIRGGICAFLYPEGTRSRDGSLQAFKKGGFKLAMQSGVPIIPVTIIGTRELLPRDSFIFRHGPVDMYLDAPLHTAHLTDEDLGPLMQTVRAAMLKRIKGEERK
jgi:1-acyl-sn-glycerol-3-phosphate acyltransferase